MVYTFYLGLLSAGVEYATEWERKKAEELKKYISDDDKKIYSTGKKPPRTLEEEATWEKTVIESPQPLKIR